MISKPFSTGHQGEMQGSTLETKKSENEQEGHCGLRHGKGVGPVVFAIWTHEGYLL